VRQDIGHLGCRLDPDPHGPLSDPSMAQGAPPRSTERPLVDRLSGRTDRDPDRDGSGRMVSAHRHGTANRHRDLRPSSLSPRCGLSSGQGFPRSGSGI